MRRWLTFLALWALVLLGGCPGEDPAGNGGDRKPAPPKTPSVFKRVIPYEGETQTKEEFDATKDAEGNFVKNGSYKRYHPNGQLAAEGSYTEGRKHGKWTYWDEEGVKIREEDYTEGVLDGHVMEFYPDGKRKRKTTYKNGEVDGHCVFFHPNGMESSAGYMVGDKRDGEWLFWTDRGKLWKKEQYKDGELVLKKDNLEKIRVNESKVVMKLKEILAGVENFKNSAHVDQDEDGDGEYGFLPELAGTAPLRTPQGKGDVTLRDRPYVDTSFGKVDEKGTVSYEGYLFRLYLPGAEEAVTSAPEVPAGDPALADNQEVYFCLYAWPQNYGVTGKRAFFVNQDRVLYATKNETRKYEGKNAPVPAAVYDRSNKLKENLMAALGTTETDKKPHDGETWYPVQ